VTLSASKRVGHLESQSCNSGACPMCTYCHAWRTGVPQHILVGVRGLGVTLGPLLFSKIVGRAIWSGNARLLGVFGLFLMSCCEAMIPQIVSPRHITVLFFFKGFAVSLLDTMNVTVLTTVHGKHSSLPFSIFHAVYGLGGVVAPYLFVATPNHCWEVLAACHGILGLALLVRRLQHGKPNDWKAKVRGTASVTSLEAGEPSLGAGIPFRPMASGLAFIFFTEAAENAMGSWAFTYAATTLGQPPISAALFPATFYLVFTSFRVALVALLWFVDIGPSTLVHMCAWLTLLGAALLQVGSSWVTTGTGEEGPAIPKRFLLLSISLVALGVCPQVGMMQASLQQHGKMSSQQLGSYSVAINLGATMGLWFPGIVSLPAAECVWAACAACIINAFVRDFPRRRH